MGDLSIRAELLAHADRIERGEVRWVNHFPAGPGESCAGFWIPPDRPPGLIADELSVETLRTLCRHLRLSDEQLGTVEEDPGIPLGTWNDAKDRTQAQVIAALRGAADSQGRDDA